jgi:hypothetical protein
MHRFTCGVRVLVLVGCVVALAASTTSRNGPVGVARPGAVGGGGSLGNDDLALAPYHRITVVSAALSATRPDGSPWHTRAPSQTWKVIGGIAGVFAGQPDLGMAAGSLFDSGGRSFGPAPIVTISFNGTTYETAALAPTLNALWNEDIIIDTSRSRAADRVVIMVRDGIDEAGVIARTELTLGDLVARDGHTLSMGASVASLELRVRAASPQPRYEVVQVTSQGLRIAFEGGDIVDLDADGEVCVSDEKCFGPDGDFDYEVTGSLRDLERPLPRGYRYNRPGLTLARHGSLVATFEGRPFPIGSSTRLRIPRSGELILWINDTDTGNNSGAFTVSVLVNQHL